MQVVVYGAGAIGSLIGARLHEAGAAVRLIGRPAHVNAIRSRGLELHGRDETRIVQLVARTTFEGSADVILLTVKSQDVADACRDIARSSLDATVVTMQNGVRSDGDAAAILGRDRVIGCVLYLSASYLEPGVIEPLPDGRLLVGAPFPESRPRLQTVAELLGRAAPTRAVPDIGRARWTKLIANLNNVVGTVTGLPVGKMFHHRGLTRLAVAVIREGVRTTEAAGVALDDGRTARRFRLMARLPLSVAYVAFGRSLGQSFSPDNAFGSSTLQSLRRGTSSELDYLNGEIVRLASQSGRPAPLNAALLERGRAAFASRQFLSPEALLGAVPIS